MKLSDVPNEFKMFKIKMSNGDFYILSGLKLDFALSSQNNFVRLPNYDGFNKSFIVNWSVDAEATKENVSKNKEKIMKIITEKTLSEK